MLRRESAQKVQEESKGEGKENVTLNPATREGDAEGRPGSGLGANELTFINQE